MELTLPAAEWRSREGLDALIEALGPEDARFVGGAVRDALLGSPVADLDLATRHQPDETTRRLRAASIRTVPTGLAHGTVTAVLPSGPVEVTTLRRDLSTDGRHAIVSYTDDWREDAARRDFTMNALYADPVTGELFDWFGGLADLTAGRVRFIGDPLQRIAEDHLRILRFFRFHARFGDAVDNDGLAACVARANDLMALSRERIAAELLKLLVAKSAVAVVRLMTAQGVLRPVLPEVTSDGVERLARLADREAATQTPPDAIRRLAALLPGDMAEGVGARLKLSNADRARLASATGPLDPQGPRVLAYRLGAEQALDRLLLSGEPFGDLAGWTPPRLPITGGALVARGLRKGPAVATALRRVEERWIAERFPDPDRVARIADEEAAYAVAAADSSA